MPGSHLGGKAEEQTGVVLIGGAPVGIASTFVRDRTILFDAFTQEPADYLDGAFVADEDARTTFDSMGIPYSEFAVELSAPARGVQVWATVKELGREGVANRIRTDNDLAALTYTISSEHPNLEPLTVPDSPSPPSATTRTASPISTPSTAMS